MLTGNQLINTIKSLPDMNEKELVRTCGYSHTQKNGAEKLDFTKFYLALLEAKGSL